MNYVRPVAVFIQWALISLFAVILVLNTMEFYSAWHSQSCFIKISQNCYPWGMKEGPMEGASWSYDSKENYLVSNFIAGAYAAFVLVICFVAPRKIRIAVLASGLITMRFIEPIAISAKPYLVEFLGLTSQV